MSDVGELVLPQNLEDVQALIDKYGPLILDWTSNIVFAIGIFILGLIFAGWAKRTFIKTLSRSEHVDVTLLRFLGSLIRYAIIAFTVLAVMGKFGIQTASLVAVLGAFGLAIGLALQGTLGDCAAGVMLLFFRPFKIGDFVEAGGTSGTVKAITLFTTDMATPDNKHIIVPNGQIWGQTITNYSHHETRRVDLEFGIDYGDNIDEAMAAIQRLLDADDRCMSVPSPLIAVSALADSSVNIVVRVWVKASDYWGVHFDLLKRVKEAFDADGISIPYPHQVIQMKGDGSEAAFPAQG
ncbi:MAG: mechanosensitive ion channel domain-containing protein [Pseudomonadota bacterium]